MLFRKYASRSRIFLWIIILSGLVMAAAATYYMLRSEPVIHKNDLKWVIPFVFLLFSVFMTGMSFGVGVLAELLIAAISGRPYDRNKFTVAALVFHLLLLIAVIKTLTGVLFSGGRI